MWVPWNVESVQSAELALFVHSMRDDSIKKSVCASMDRQDLMRMHNCKFMSSYCPLTSSLSSGFFNIVQSEQWIERSTLSTQKFTSSIDVGNTLSMDPNP